MPVDSYILRKKSLGVATFTPSGTPTPVANPNAGTVSANNTWAQIANISNAISSGVNVVGGVINTGFNIANQVKTTTQQVKDVVQPTQQPTNTVYVQSPTPPADKQPTFFEKNQNAILIGGAAFLLLGVFAVANSGGSQHAPVIVTAPSAPMAGVKRKSKSK